MTHGMVRHSNTLYYSNSDALDLSLGTKNVAKKMAKIAQGAARSEGVTWFRQLSDKRKILAHSKCKLV